MKELAESFCQLVPDCYSQSVGSKLPLAIYTIDPNAEPGGTQETKYV